MPVNASRKYRATFLQKLYLDDSDAA